MALITDLRIEAATERDVPVILSLIKALAEYERMAGDVVATEAHVHSSFFGSAPSAEVVIARLGSEPVGSEASSIPIGDHDRGIQKCVQLLLSLVQRSLLVRVRLENPGHLFPFHVSVSPRRRRP